MGFNWTNSGNFEPALSTVSTVIEPPKGWGRQRAHNLRWTTLYLNKLMNEDRLPVARDATGGESRVPHRLMYRKLSFCFVYVTI